MKEVQFNVGGYSKSMFKLALAIEEDIVKTIIDNGKSFIDLQACHTNGDAIYAYKFDEETQGFVEEEIVAIHAIENDEGKPELFVLSQPIYYQTRVVWSEDDIKNSFYDTRSFDGSGGTWNSLFRGDISGTATAYNLAEALDNL